MSNRLTLRTSFSNLENSCFEIVIVSFIHKNYSMACKVEKLTKNYHPPAGTPGTRLAAPVYHTGYQTEGYSPATPAHTGQLSQDAYAPFAGCPPGMIASRQCRFPWVCLRFVFLALALYRLCLFLLPP